eukprot:g3343.t1
MSVFSVFKKLTRRTRFRIPPTSNANRFVRFSSSDMKTAKEHKDENSITNPFLKLLSTLGGPSKTNASPAPSPSYFMERTKNLISSASDLLLYKYASGVAEKRSSEIFPVAERVAAEAIAKGLAPRDVALRAAMAAADKVLDEDENDLVLAVSCARAAATSTMMALDADGEDVLEIANVAAARVESGERGKLEYEIVKEDGDMNKEEPIELYGPDGELDRLTAMNRRATQEQMVERTGKNMNEKSDAVKTSTPLNVAVKVPEIALLDDQEERYMEKLRKYDDISEDNDSIECLEMESQSGIYNDNQWTAVVANDGVRQYRTRQRRETERFMDRVRIQVQGGYGGSGCNAFLKFHQPGKKSPDGGNGGKGGDVIIRATESMRMLSLPKRHFKGEAGQNGRGAKRHGRKGKDKIVHVPVGTIISEVEVEYDDMWWCDESEQWFGGDEKETLKVVADLSSPGDEYCAAKGGNGGMGNGRFAGKQHLMASHQLRMLRDSPLSKIHHVKGCEPEHSFLDLEMKCIASVGLVGFPNAGKSTLLRALSRAMPKVAAYKFTTLTPNIGVIHYADGHSITVADLPGLIDGAHDNRGLGHEFLRHIERTDVLLYVLDAAGSEGRDPKNDFRNLFYELEKYSPTLVERKSIIAANKLDIDPRVLRNERNEKEDLLWDYNWEQSIENDERVQDIRDVTELPVVPVSASEKVGVRKLAVMLRALVAAAQRGKKKEAII